MHMVYANPNTHRRRTESTQGRASCHHVSVSRLRAGPGPAAASTVAARRAPAAAAAAPMGKSVLRCACVCNCRLDRLDRSIDRSIESIEPIATPQMTATAAGQPPLAERRAAPAVAARRWVRAALGRQRAAVRAQGRDAALCAPAGPERERPRQAGGPGKAACVPDCDGMGGYRCPGVGLPTDRTDSIAPSPHPSHTHRPRPSSPAGPRCARPPPWGTGSTRRRRPSGPEAGGHHHQEQAAAAAGGKAGTMRGRTGAWATTTGRAVRPVGVLLLLLLLLLLLHPCARLCEDAPIHPSLD